MEKFKWGKTVRKHLLNADAVLGNSLVAEILDRARVEFGRDNLV